MDRKSLAKALKEERTGEKVLLMSNEDEPILVGTIESWMSYTKTKQWIPHIKVEDGSIRVCFGAILPYSEKLKEFLGSLPYKERWNLYSALVQLRGDLNYISEHYAEPEEEK